MQSTMKQTTISTTITTTTFRFHLISLFTPVLPQIRLGLSKEGGVEVVYKLHAMPVLQLTVMERQLRPPN